MKAEAARQSRVQNIQSTVTARQRSKSRKPVWIIVLVTVASLSLIGVYVFPSEKYTACYFFGSSVCVPFMDWLPPAPVKEYTDEELAANAVFHDLLLLPPVHVSTPKVAFLFLTPGTLPFEKLWEKFFLGHEGRYSIYVHASRESPVHASSLFVNSDIRSDQVSWGEISMVDAEKRLLANALQDPDNQHFVLLSDSCVPLQNFEFVYRYLMETNISYIDCFDDPGPLGMGRYSTKMLPEIEKRDWRKGSQWFTMKRQHALIVLADNLYYTKFKLHCQRGVDGLNCYSDEHYLPTLFNMVDPMGIANWSVTYVDWSEGKWHPRAFKDEDTTYELLQNISSIEEFVHISSDEKRDVYRVPCAWNETRRPCHLFARKFYPEALDNLLNIFSSYANT
ncbi:glycosyltransferase BC10-like [Wolffia australiana]